MGRGARQVVSFVVADLRPLLVVAATALLILGLVVWRIFRARRRTAVSAAPETLPAPTPAPHGAILLAESGSLAGTRFAVDHEPFWIGAEGGNDLSIAEDDYLSSRHARLYFQDGTLLIQDQGSTNGTFVNGERLGATPRPLGPGDRIRAGHTELVVLAS